MYDCGITIEQEDDSYGSPIHVYVSSRGKALINNWVNGINKQRLPYTICYQLLRYLQKPERDKKEQWDEHERPETISNLLRSLDSLAE
jgi:hypothetical protein